MRKQLETEIKVGIFITIGLALVMSAVIMLGGTDNLFARKVRYHSKFDSVDGLVSGARVILGGVPIGTVEDIAFDNQLRKIIVTLAVSKNSEDWIRKDSSVEIATQGVLGDKYLTVNVGTMENPVMPPGSEIPVTTGKDIAHFLNKGDQLIASLLSISSSLDRVLKSFETDHRNEAFFKGMAESSKNLAQLTDKMNREMDNIQLKKAISNMAQITDKLNNGSGTIGAFINDPSLYDEIKALFGGVNRNRIIRNLVRQSVTESSKPAASETPSPRP
ncbi:MAG: MCE family protein [Bdellovibrio sp.]|nr:MCE family protein [Bdellovibrio sp.]